MVAILLFLALLLCPSIADPPCISCNNAADCFQCVTVVPQGNYKLVTLQVKPNSQCDKKLGWVCCQGTDSATDGNYCIEQKCDDESLGDEDYCEEVKKLVVRVRKDANEVKLFGHHGLFGGEGSGCPESEQPCCGARKVPTTRCGVSGCMFYVDISQCEPRCSSNADCESSSNPCEKVECNTNSGRCVTTPRSDGYKCGGTGNEDPCDDKVCNKGECKFKLGNGASCTLGNALPTDDVCSKQHCLGRVCKYDLDIGTRCFVDPNDDDPCAVKVCNGQHRCDNWELAEGKTCRASKNPCKNKVCKKHRCTNELKRGDICEGNTSTNRCDDKICNATRDCVWDLSEGASCKVDQTQDNPCDDFVCYKDRTCGLKNPEGTTCGPDPDGNYNKCTLAPKCKNYQCKEQFASSSTVCNPKNITDLCDLPDLCTGTNGKCRERHETYAFTYMCDDQHYLCGATLDDLTLRNNENAYKFCNLGLGRGLDFNVPPAGNFECLDNCIPHKCPGSNKKISNLVIAKCAKGGWTCNKYNGPELEDLFDDDPNHRYCNYEDAVH